VASEGTLHHAVGGYAPPLGILLRADGLAAALIVTFAVVSAALGTYALVEARPRAREQKNTARSPETFAPAWLLSWAALNALVLSGDVFNLYVTLELTTLSAVTLLSMSGDPAGRAAGSHYVLFALVGSMAYLLGLVLLYGAYATLDLGLLRARVAPDAVSYAAFALMTLGVCLKAGLFPLHAWVPLAYARSPAPIGAILSALIAKGPFCVMLRLWYELFPAVTHQRAGLLLAFCGSFGALWGAVLAMRQARLRALVAYSSISQIGTLFVLFALGTPEARGGGIYLAISHAVAKASMFLAAGNIERCIGTDELRWIGGLGHSLPLSFFAFGLSGASLMGLPPSGGFIAKWLLLRAAADAGQWWLVAVILLGGLLSAGYVFRVVRGAFLASESRARAQAVASTGALHTQPSRLHEQLALALALLSIALGVASAPLLALLNVGVEP
jgi:formate hydrogenlyase subunit 3/multisubunit Na+/H+ antiporter MnhD subunit